MKTVSDLAACIKRNGGMQLSYDGSKFVVGMNKATASSKHLDDALENLTEELRRLDSGMVLKDKDTETTRVSFHMVVAACGACTADGGICPKCNNLPSYILGGNFSCWKCAGYWLATPQTGNIYAFRMVTGGTMKYKFNGTDWERQP
jgi:hypothetical protein